MATWQTRFRKLVIASGITCATLSFTVLGCSKPSAPESTKTDNAPSSDISHETAKLNTTAAVNETEATPVNFDQSFEEAALTEVLEGHQLPPDVTFGGMKTGLLRMEIEESWRKIKLTDASGMPLPQTIRIETIEGSIEITLRPEFAPNHVRNMIALTRAGFYDGLQFERVVHQQSELDGQTTRLDMVIAGCPTGTGDDGFGHIGYFMRSEFQQHVKHAAGTVGFWHEEDPDSAGCRFYITLGPAPLLDGKFTIIGSVSKGLDAVHRIASAPRQSVDVSPENEKPIAPIAIKKASVVELADKNMN